VFVISKANASAFFNDDNVDTFSSESDVSTVQGGEDEHSISVVSEKSTEDIVYKIAYAEDENNFIFVGKGWGHGVGMSQYGARDLADLGSTAEEILSAYFMDIEIIDYIEANGFK
jgi:SpoIID/LytB domain protein